MADASRIVLADCLGATESPRLTRAQRLLQGELQPAGTCTVIAFRIQDRRRAMIAGALAELDGRDVFAGCVEDNAVVFAPGGEAARLVDELEDLLGTPLCVATADCDPLVDGYRQAAKVLDLVLAAERDPGLYRLDDFLIEYAAMCDPTVSARLVNIVRPLLSCERLYETLKAFVRCGYDPTAGRSGQVLAAAVTLFSLRGAHIR